MGSRKALFLPEACRPLHLRDCLAATGGTRLPEPRGRGHSSQLRRHVPRQARSHIAWLKRFRAMAAAPTEKCRPLHYLHSWRLRPSGRLSEELRRVAPSSEESTATSQRHRWEGAEEVRMSGGPGPELRAWTLCRRRRVAAWTLLPSHGSMRGLPCRNLCDDCEADGIRMARAGGASPGRRRGAGGQPPTSARRALATHGLCLMQTGFIVREVAWGDRPMELLSKAPALHHTKLL